MEIEYFYVSGRVDTRNEQAAASDPGKLKTVRDSIIE